MLNSRNITINDLAIPDTYCSPRANTGYSCPRGMKCVDLDLKRRERGFSGFDEFGQSYLLTYLLTTSTPLLLLVLLLQLRYLVCVLSDDCLSVCLPVCLLHTSGLTREQTGLGRLKLAQR